MKSNELEKLHEIIKKKNAEIDRLTVLIKDHETRQQGLKEELDYYEEILTHMPGHVYWLDNNNIYLGCNDLHAKSTGFKSRHEIVGKTNRDMPWKERADEIDDFNNFVMKSDVAQTKEEYTFINNEKRTFLSRKVPLRNRQNKVIGIVGISIDITDRKNMEALLVAKEAAEAANHAKTEFIANMSHDIRTPLTGVVGMSKLIENSVQDTTQKKYAHYLGESGDQLLHMLNGILDVITADNANDNDVHEEPFDLRQMINDILELERPTTLLKGLEFIIQVDEVVPSCFVSDHIKLHRILLNLLGNAIKFTSTGRVELSVQCLSQTNDHALIQFRVTDTGIGIPPELQNKVFDRFFRVAPSYKAVYTGHGVGLHIAQSYAHLLGGEIVLKSTLGVGTTFYLELSLKISIASLIRRPTNYPSQYEQSNIVHPESIPKPIKVAVNPSPLPKDAPHLLLIEDNPIALCVLQTLVTNANCRFTNAMDGETGFDLAKTKSFDLIITDIGLPCMSGIEMTSLLRKFERKHHKKSIPIVGLTAHADAQTKDECIHAGMNDVFNKPMQANVLESIKSTYLIKSTKISNPVTKASYKVTPDKLGIDLPDTEDQLFLLNRLPLLNANIALKSLGNKIELFNEILTLLIERDLVNDLNEIKRAHQHGNWDAIEKIAHRMKGGFVYCGLTKLAIACQYLERYHKAQHSTQLEALYQQVLTVSEETVTTIKKWLSMQ